MLKSIAHIHFLEGERGPEEASLKFEDGISLLERYSIEEAVVTFHLRHPSDLRLASPQELMKKIVEYDGPVKITLMPEANLVLSSNASGGSPIVTHDIDAGKDLEVVAEGISSLIAGWIVSAHYTKELGWPKKTDEDDALEQTYDCAADLYVQIMAEDWHGWIGHPFRWCTGKEMREPLIRTLAAAAKNAHLLEIPVVEFSPGKSSSGINLQSDAIAQFASQSIASGCPLVAISCDAHHLRELSERIEASFRLAEWLVFEGVHPEQIWGWRSS